MARIFSSGLHDDATASCGLRISRRRFHAGGVMLVAAGLVGGTGFGARGQTQPQLAARPATAGVISKAGGTKPTFLPEPGSTDPVAHSVAENLFWNDQLAEHAVFFNMLMPGPELAKQRAQVDAFKLTFTNLLAQSRRGLDKANYAAFNRTSIEQAKKFVAFKHQMRDEQVAGRLKSLVWPTFFEHTAREAEHFIARLELFSRGDVAIGEKDAIAFWSEVMGDHADFVAHLLDPKELELVKKAMAASEAFKKLPAEQTSAKEAAMRAVDEIIDFKVAAAKGIETGQIKSIIHPVLADHVRREALKAADEIGRST
jgi:hypothetical protein